MRIVLENPDANPSMGFVQAVTSWIERHPEVEVSFLGKAPPYSSADTFVERLIQTRGPDAFMGRITNPAVVQRLQEHGIFVLSWKCGQSSEACPVLRIDYEKAGVLGTEFLLSRGYGRIVLAGHSGDQSLEMEEGVRACCSKSGVPFEVWNTWAFEPEDRNHIRVLARKIRGLHGATGFLAAGDREGIEVLRGAHRAKARVPDDLGVLGTGNRELMCLQTFPPLSSLRMAWSRMMDTALDTLKEGVEGRMPRWEEISFRPEGIAERRSTDVFRVGDPLIERALRWMHARPRRVNELQDLSNQLGISMRHLQRRFREVRGYSMREEIARNRVRRAKELLMSTDDSITRVAMECGFDQPGRFSREFKKLTGVLPREYRFG